jgi:dUTP pyrophosphatase
MNPNFLELQIFTENPELKKKYQERVIEHNKSVGNNEHADSGFDLHIPRNYTIASGSSQKINLEIKCAMFRHTYNSKTPQAYYMYPRSSMGSKTRLRLANSVGIIDSGYRGNLGAVLDNIGSDVENTNTDRLLQICSPTLQPFMVTIIESEEELGRTTRGENGFGSTGNN